MAPERSVGPLLARKSPLRHACQCLLTREYNRRNREVNPPRMVLEARPDPTKVRTHTAVESV